MLTLRSLVWKTLMKEAAKAESLRVEASRLSGIADGLNDIRDAKDNPYDKRTKHYKDYEKARQESNKAWWAFNDVIRNIGLSVLDHWRVGANKRKPAPKIVCLCGSTRFSEAFQQANFDETLAGNIVLTIGCDMKSDSELFKDKTEVELEEVKKELDQLHLRKIDLADEVLILNVGGYIGNSTSRELAYAKERCKEIRFLVPQTRITE